MENAPTAPPPSVLVVEDNPGDARLVEIYLTDPADPFRVRKAARLDEALAKLAAEKADVVLLDLSLPDSFGLSTLQRLRAAHPLVPVVVLTGTDDEAAAIQALRQGAQDYLVKGRGDSDLIRRAIRHAIERAHVAEALRQSEARFRALFENAAIGVVLARPDGRFVEANPAFCGMVGYGEAELREKTFQDITHPDDVAANMVLRDAMLRSESAGYTMAKRYIARDGRIVWVRLSVTPMRGDSGDVRYLVAVAEDITERKRLEEHMRLAATVFEHTGEGLMVTDADNRIILVNPAFSDLTGYEAEDVMGRNPSILSSGRHGADFYQAMWQRLSETGKWQGEIWNRRKTGEMFAAWLNLAAVPDDSGRVVNYTGMFSDITTRKKAEEDLSFKANYDPLTRLPNRTLFQERLGRALARATRNRGIVALLFIDLDRFKEVNDTLGHLAGDKLLQQVAGRLVGTIRQGDTAARLAGDEFTVILEDVDEPRDAALVANKLLTTLGEAYDLDGTVAEISGSIGVALFPADAGDAHTLMTMADAAMYRAKREGRNVVRFSSDDMTLQANRRLVLEKDFARALDQGELELDYQPFFDSEGTRALGAEVLLRWRDPDIGSVSARQAVGIAEEAGLALPLARWVAARACAQAKLWREMGFEDFKVAINLSARQLCEVGLPEALAQALEGAGLPPDALEVEIAEAAIACQRQEAPTLLARLKAMGIGLVIDDFGAGHSSLAGLRHLPVDALKVSQSFVRGAESDGDDADLLGAMVVLARGLRLAVAAPGIETDAQLAFVRRTGCDRLQGFLLADPQSPETLTEYLRAGKRPRAAKDGRKDS